MGIICIILLNTYNILITDCILFISNIIISKTTTLNHSISNYNSSKTMKFLLTLHINILFINTLQNL